MATMRTFVALFTANCNNDETKKACDQDSRWRQGHIHSSARRAASFLDCKQKAHESTKKKIGLPKDGLTKNCGDGRRTTPDRPDCLTGRGIVLTGIAATAAHSNHELRD